MRISPAAVVMGILTVVPAALLSGAAALAVRPDCVATLAPADAASIRGVIESYRTSWLKGDARGVLDTLTPDAVLLPAHGAAPVIGTEAITKYWWPPNAAPTKITKLEITVEDLEGDCRLAYAHGRDDVAWTVEESGATKAYGHPGTYLNVMRKSPDGRWRISRHMWDDGAPR